MSILQEINATVFIRKERNLLIQNFTTLYQSQSAVLGRGMA